jgi:hypothetical protein
MKTRSVEPLEVYGMAVAMIDTLYWMEHDRKMGGSGSSSVFNHCLFAPSYSLF